MSLWDLWKSPWVGCGVLLFVALGGMVGCDEAKDVLVGAAQAEEEAQADEDEESGGSFSEQIRRAIEEGNYAERSIVGRMVAADIRVAEIRIRQLSEIVTIYYMRNEELPETFEDLVEIEMLREVPVDPWGNEYVYEVEGKRDFVLLSKGPDGEAGTERDVTGE